MLKERFSNLLAIIINFNKINNKTGFEENEWSVLEHYYFLHALASFGMPSDKNWSDFEKSFPNLFRNKTANSVQKRIKLLKEEIEICLKSDKNEIKDFKNGDLSNKKIVKLTQKGALNLKRRFDFFKLLRDKIKTLNISSLNFEWREQPPVWWDSPKMDLDLLKGCLKYGVGNWVKLKGDKNYQFSNSPQISFRHIQKLLLNRFMSLGQFIISGKNNLSSNPIKNNYKNNFSFFLNNQSPKIASKMQTLTNQNSLLKIQKTPNNKTQIPFNFNNGNNKKENFLLKPNKIFKSIDIRPVPQNNSMITPSLLLQSIGNIEFLRSNFHNNSYIFPIGYKTVRKYISFVDPTKNCKYVNEILDGKSCPIFSVTCEHAPNSPIQQIHPTSAWKLVNSKIKLANPNKTVLVPIDGLERFGLNEPKIRSLIDRLPNVSKCKQYGSQFKVGSFGYPFNLNPVSNVGNNSRSKMLHKKNNVPPPPKNF
ncbi:hypothetical protein MHBO_000072 [Bonamia ostreae]|uniref:Uncharacterized protein n=1 Tax=Bonamia ostreae TaxID=126728 RepID=A0ABV2AEC7_9EUKA